MSSSFLVFEVGPRDRSEATPSERARRLTAGSEPPYRAPMEHRFASLAEFADALEGGFSVDDLDGAFVDRERWSADPTQTELVFWDEADSEISDEEFERMTIDEIRALDRDGRPRLAIERGLDYLLVGPLLVDVLQVMKQQGKALEPSAMIRAIAHYAEFDCFEP